MQAARKGGSMRLESSSQGACPELNPGTPQGPPNSQECSLRTRVSPGHRGGPQVKQKEKDHKRKEVKADYLDTDSHRERHMSLARGGALSRIPNTTLLPEHHRK